MDLTETKKEEQETAPRDETTRGIPTSRSTSRNTRTNANAERWSKLYARDIVKRMIRLSEELVATPGGGGRRRYPESRDEMISQMRLFGEIGGMVLAREGRSFVIDKDNESVISLLIAYVNRWSDTLQTIGSKYFGTSVDPDRSLMIMGDKGVGKTLLMQVTARLCEVLGLTESGFVNTSSSELLNYFRTNSSLDYFTYNSGRVAVKEGNPYSAKPFNVCLHDLDYQHDEKQKHYGVSMQDVMEDFLMARYELWQNQGLKYHVTTNLDVAGLAKYSPRVVDRFRQHNYIRMTGESRR